MTTRALLGCALALTAAGCRSDAPPATPPSNGPPPAERPISFVQVTDPHLFVEKKFVPKGSSIEPDSAARDSLEQEDREAFKAFLLQVGTLPRSQRPQFMLITGDWGLDAINDVLPVADRRNGPRWTEQVNLVAQMINASPIDDIYWVPGNNDVVDEVATPAGLAEADDLTAPVRAKAAGKRFTNLTHCYVSGDGRDCVFEILPSKYSLVGVPTMSFKNKLDVTVPNRAAIIAANQAYQEKLLQTTDSIVKAQVGAGKSVLLATHIPELDDPFTKSQLTLDSLDSIATKPNRKARAPHSDHSGLRASAWNVNDPSFVLWKGLVDSKGVAAVIAGHFHDPNRPIYDPPYLWSESSTRRAKPEKTLVAPPLSEKVQTKNTPQARGFALITLLPDRVVRRIYWMDRTTHQFTSATTTSTVRP